MHLVRKRTAFILAIFLIGLAIGGMLYFIRFGPWQEYDGANCAWDSCYEDPTVRWYNYWVDVAIKSRTPFFCDFVIPRSWGDVVFVSRGQAIDFCKLDYVKSTLDVTFCDRIKSSSRDKTDEEIQEHCFSTIAIYADTIEKCDQLQARKHIQDRVLELCYESVSN